MDLFNSKKWATPLAIGTFAVSGITGILMFSELHFGIIKDVHEWIGLVTVGGILFHVLKNWVSFKRYFSKTSALSIMGVFLVVLIVSFLPLQKERNRERLPFFEMAHVVQTTTLPVAAQLLKTDEKSLNEKLEAKGIHVISPDQTLTEIAKSNGKNVAEVLNALFVNKQKRERDRD